FLTNIFPNLEIVSIIFLVNRQLEIEIIKNSDINAIIQVLKYKFVKDFDDNIYRLIGAGCTQKNNENSEFYITKNTRLSELDNLILFKNEIIKIFVCFKNSVTSEILNLFDSFTNLKNIEIHCKPIENCEKFLREFYIFKYINKILLRRYKMEKHIVQGILNLSNLRILIVEHINNEIKDFDLIHNFQDENINILRFLNTLKKLESLIINSTNLSKILSKNEFKNFISNQNFKTLTLSSDECNFFEIPYSLSCRILEDFHFSGKFSSGTTNGLFSGMKITDLKQLSISYCYINQKDSLVLEQLNSLVYLDIDNCNFQNITVTELFCLEKEYVIQEMILIGVKIYINDIKFISKLKYLVDLTLNNCKFCDKSFLHLKGSCFYNLEYFFISYSNATEYDEGIDYLTEEFDKSILTITWDIYDWY
ncbi:hypothetical protein CWI36_2219p0010, partial [Hamiltosporidium magnivora]